MIMNVINYGILIYANYDTKILQKLIDKIIGIIGFTKDKEKISNLKSENNIMNIENYNKLEWIKLAHDIIHNSIKLPEYYKKLFEIKQNRNGIVINTNYRKSKYGDKISYNIMEDIWNKLDMNQHRIQDKNILIDNITSNILKKQNLKTEEQCIAKI